MKPGDEFFYFFLLTTVLPLLLGLLFSFLLIGKTRLLLWIAVYLAVYFVFNLLMAQLLPKKLVLLHFLSEWFRAVIVIAIAWLLRRDVQDKKARAQAGADSVGP